MKIIKPSATYLGTVPTDYDGAIRFIEAAGRTCYKSEDRITADSAEKFVRKLIRAGHLAMVEHSNFVVRIPLDLEDDERIINALPSKYLNGHWNAGIYYAGGNLTAWFQAALAEGPDPIFEPFCQVYADLFGHDLTEVGASDWQICPHDEIPPELHRHAVRFICDRGVSHELVRHRPTAMDWYGEFIDSPIDLYKVFDASAAQESTRYVSYTNGIEVIEPHDWDSWTPEERDAFEIACMIAEKSYRRLRDAGRSPQQARAVLPTALRTEVVVTADPAEWRHIRSLRTAAAAHPDMQRVMNMVPWGSIV